MFVSVLIDTYNHERFIEKAVRSVLDQDFPASDREVIVVDDGSTDRTPQLLAQFGSQIRVLRKPNGGQASAFNAGIPECRGDFIALLDGDDWWAPGKLRRVCNILAADDSIGMVGHAFIESFADGTERPIALDENERIHLDTLHAANAFRLHRCYFGTSRMTLRASLARKILPVPESLVFEADEYIFTLAPALAPSVILTDPLTYYRLHGSNLFVAAGASAEGERRKQKVLAALAASLRKALPEAGTPPDVTDCVLEMVEAEAAQLRLKLDGGSPLETYRTEATIYRTQHADASWKQKLFHESLMLPALILPPRAFYAARQWLATRSWYKQARRDYLPVPEFTKVTPPSTLDEHS